MLDRLKLIAELQSLADVLFVDTTSSVDYAQRAWNQLVHDPSFLYKVLQVINPPWPVPLWSDSLGATVSVAQRSEPYVVFSVDGSQIYPDRHNILSCCLINSGSVVIPYALEGKRVEFYSEPTVFAGLDDTQTPYTVDSVNCKRQELELAAGLALGKRIAHTYGVGTFSTLLFDGSLIFWHLLSKEHEVKDYFLGSYMLLLEQLYQEKITTAWYISMPKSKELMSLIRLYLCNFDYHKKELYEVVDSVIDSSIMYSFLMPHSRTIVFRNRSAISDYYPAYLAPYFFYIHTGAEIGRIEIPGWIAHNESLVDDIASLLIDQCIKGHGYPVALAEAHEQAVVKGPDREFFYHYLQKIGIERQQKLATSRKSMQKRGMAI